MIRGFFGWMGRVVAVAVLIVVFCVSVLVGALLHLDLRAVRRIVEGKVNAALSAVPENRIRITGLTRLSTQGARIDVVDADVERVGHLHAENVRIDVGLVRTLRNVLLERNPVSIRVRGVSASLVTVELRPAPRSSSTPIEEAPHAKSDLHLDVARIDVAHGHLHGPLGNGPLLDVECDRTTGSFAIDPEHAQVATTTTAIARGLLAVPLSIEVNGSGSVPLGSDDIATRTTAARTAQVTLVAKAGDVWLEAAATLQGDNVAAEVTAPETAPEAIRALVPEWPLSAPVSFHARVAGTVLAPTFQCDADVGSGHLTSTGRAYLEGPARAEMNIVAHAIELSALFKALPALRIDFDANLDAAPNELRATARIHDRGATVVTHASLTRGFLDARAVLEAGRVSWQDSSIDSAHAEVEVAGSLERLGGQLSARIAGLRRGALSLNDLQVMAGGTSDSVDVELAGKGGSLDVLALEATIEPKAAVRIAGLTARLERAQKSIAVSAPEIVVDGRNVDVGHFQVRGLGEPIEGEIHLSPGRVQTKIAGPAVDLAPLSGFVSSASGWVTGNGSIDVDLDTGPRSTRGSAHVRLAHARIGSWPEVDAVLDVEVDGAHGDGWLVVENTDLGEADLEAHLDAGRPITNVRSLLDAKSSVVATTEGLPVERLCAAFRCSDAVARATTSIKGTVRSRLEITRETAGPTGDTKAAFEVEVADADGRLAHANIWSQANLAHALALGRLPADAPLEARFSLESRPFEKLPAVFQPLPLSGRLEMHGYAQGTISQPFFVAEVRGSDLRAAGALPEVPRLQLSWVTTYDLEDAASDIDLRIGDAHVVRASLQVEASLAQVLGAPGDKPWSGGLYAEVDRFPLSLIPSLADREASGALSGKVSISGVHQNPAAAAHFSIDDLHFGSDAIGPVAISFEANQERCLASLDAGSPSSPNSGRATLRASAGCRWKDASMLSIVPDASAEIALDAMQFPLAPVEPLLTAVFGRLRGTLDAHLRASGLPNEAIGRWAVRGEAHARNTTLLPLVLGREIARLDVEATADGTGTVRVPRFSGEMGSGSFTGEGSLLLRENRVDQAHAELHVARRKAIPVTMEGVSYGTVWGDVIADAHVADGQLLMSLKAPTLRLELPPQRTGNLETLSRNEAVVVLQPLSSEPPSSAVGGGPNPERPHVPRIVASVELGDNVGVSRDDLKIELTTPPSPQNPKIALDGDVTIEGSIRLLGGRVPVAGRVFRVERGMVLFSGSDPADPALDVDAVYEGPETSITIKVHVGGTAKDAKITLQSTPAKSQSEILAILTFGEAAPATAGPGGLAGPQQAGPSTVAGAAGSAAAGVGSAIVTTGLNQILSQSIIPIRTSISTSTTSTASASATVDFSERVRIEYIRSFGTPTQVGQQVDDNQFAFAWRFKPRWMLRTIVGTRGTAALDLLWQRWY